MSNWFKERLLSLSGGFVFLVSSALTGGLVAYLVGSYIFEILASKPDLKISFPWTLLTAIIGSFIGFAAWAMRHAKNIADREKAERDFQQKERELQQREKELEQREREISEEFEHKRQEFNQRNNEKIEEFKHKNQELRLRETEFREKSIREDFFRLMDRAGDSEPSREASRMSAISQLPYYINMSEYDFPSEQNPYRRMGLQLLRALLKESSSIVDNKENNTIEVHSNHQLLHSFVISALLESSRFLSGIDLSNCFLSKVDLRGVDLNDANFAGSCLKGTNLAGASLRKAVLQNADLRGVCFKRTNLQGAQFEGADLAGANLEKAGLGEASPGPNEGAYLTGSEVKANLKKANLEKANMIEAYLSGANLERANLNEAQLYRANLQETNLKGAQLRKAKIEGVELRRAFYDSTTIFPYGFEPKKHGMILVE